MQGGGSVSESGFNTYPTYESPPRILDLFCGAGGAADGYHRAGFDVVGVDVRAQPNYPFEFVEADALDVLRWGVAGRHLVKDFDAIHASPPCQAYSALAAMHPATEYERLIEPVRDLLQRTRLPFVIENVERAPMQRQAGLFGLHGIVLCGSMFGLGVARGQLRRHRLFESNLMLGQPPHEHKGRAVGVYGHGGHTKKHRMLYRKEAAEAMQIDWMNRDELSQAIPPAYTEFIGGQLLAVIGATV